jgi:SNF2 family DNA or RNA helicase
MSKDVSVELLNDNFILKGNLSLLRKNARLSMSLNRLGADIASDSISIPFLKDTKTETLQQINRLFEKFDYSVNYNSDVKEQFDAYHQELSNFKAFSDKAGRIRENDLNQELVDDFKDFKNILKGNMARTLYDLQILSSYHMAFSQNSCNFSVPGAGKTSIVYGAYCYLKSLPENDAKHVDKILVVGPLSSFSPWENEYKECFGTSVDSQRLSGDQSTSSNSKKEHLYSSSPAELTLISHAGIQNLEKEIIDFLKQHKTMVVVDEAHRIKNAEGVWGKSIVEISKEAKSRVALTGTPVPNGYEDLYNIFRFIYPFRFKEILNIHYEQLKDLTKNLVSTENSRVEELINNIKPYFIRIKKRDLNLPKTEENYIQVLMGQSQREIYDYIEDKYIGKFQGNPSGTFKDVLNKARLIRLRQAATNPSLLLKTLKESLEDSSHGSDPNLSISEISNESINDSHIFQKVSDFNNKKVIPEKFKKVNEIIEKEILPSKGKVIVWSIFIQNSDDLKKYLSDKGIASKLLIGRIPQDKREEVVQKFNDPRNNEFQVVIANPFSVSESISLHKGCHNAIYLERDYNASNFLQSKDRIHRVGIDKNVVTKYFYLMSSNSIDEVINNRLDKKIERMMKIIDEEVPLFIRVNDLDESDIISDLLKDYARRA